MKGRGSSFPRCLLHFLCTWQYVTRASREADEVRRRRRGKGLEAAEWILQEEEGAGEVGWTPWVLAAGRAGRRDRATCPWC